MGGRQVRREADQLFDHYEADYTFPDGTRLLALARHLTGCWNFFGEVSALRTGGLSGWQNRQCA